MFSLRNYIIILLLLSLGAIAQISAQTTDQAITQRQIHQAMRIRQGVKNGQLTRREAKILHAEQRKIQRDKVKAESNGRITGREAQKIKAEQNAASDDIYIKKHNKRVR